MQSEKEIENSIIEFLRNIGLDPVLKIIQDHRTCRTHKFEPGVPDIITWLPNGIGCGIEVKNKVGKPSPAQMKMITRINSTRGVAFVSRSVWQTYMQLLPFWPEIKTFEYIAKQYKQIQDNLNKENH